MPFYQPQHHEQKNGRARTILWWAKPACFDSSSSNFLEIGDIYIYIYGVEVLGCQGLLAECVGSNNPKLWGTWSTTTAYKFTNQSFFSFLFTSILFCWEFKLTFFTHKSSPLSRGLLLHVNPRFFRYDSPPLYVSHTSWSMLANPPPHHPLDAYYYLVVDELQPSYYLVQVS